MKTCARLHVQTETSFRETGSAIASGDASAASHRYGRRGAVMVFALMALLVASLMIGALLKTASMSHRQLKRDEYRLQTSFLADAGCERARMLLRTQPDFTSGEWNVPAEQLAPERTALVRMTVTTEPDQPTEQIITAIAQYPIGHPDLVRITRQIRIN